MVGETKGRQFLPQPSNVFVHTGNAPVVIGELLLPITWKKGEVARNKLIAITVSVSLRCNETTAVILEMRLKIGDHQKERLARPLAQETQDAFGDEIDAVDISEMNLLVVRVPDGSFI